MYFSIIHIRKYVKTIFINNLEKIATLTPRSDYVSPPEPLGVATSNFAGIYIT